MCLNTLHSADQNPNFSCVMKPSKVSIMEKFNRNYVFSRRREVREGSSEWMDKAYISGHVQSKHDVKANGANW